MFHSGGQSITWHEPPPVGTVTDDQVVHTNNIQLYKGSINKRLNWTFTLAQDPVSISLELDGSSVATVVPPLVRVFSPFSSKVNVTWVSGQITLIIFNVTIADEGVYSCEMTSTNVKKWKRNIKVEVVGNYKVIVCAIHSE